MLPVSAPLTFPDPLQTDSDGLLAAGGNPEPRTLLAACRSGIFPWYEPGGPILWWSPDPRMVLFPAGFHCSRRLARRLRQGLFRITRTRHSPMWCGDARSAAKAHGSMRR